MNSYLGSSGVHVASRGDALARFDKYPVVLREPGFAAMFRACGRPVEAPPGVLNCGRCSKCVRVQLELLAHGEDLAAYSFPPGSLTVERVHGLRHRIRKEAEFLVDLPGGLRARGFEEYALIVEGHLAAMERQRTPVARLTATARRLLRRRQ